MQEGSVYLKVRLPTVRQAATVLVSLIGLFVLMDLFDGRSVTQWPFGLDSEQAPHAAYAALLLFGAGLLAGSLAWYSDRHRLLVAVMAAALFFMSYDEAFILHEQIESSLERDWQLIYAPVIVVFGVAWLLVLIRVLRPRRTQLYWVLGAACWAVAQLFEKLQWSGDEDQLVHPWMVVPEEALEMLGSTFWLLALLATLRLVLGGDDAPAEQGDEAVAGYRQAPGAQVSSL